ncbi:hypothetical protein [Tengunoibacter tsumagoiensis]|uniref:Uncharacterized protein n=1 Tax=Tengunoibacter tsumagoiensis TaxID=2014871 RepID=A0A401ZWG0_9CHLR|nr:hypothetical protein [Tengunoibacter tsumagoiensis]GCE11142.1 hypothetical protein KTT_10010 [Tengunoibacter tsumagoiensis]
MTTNELASAAQRMQQKWSDLIKAEQQGATLLQLERLYSSYMLAVEEYNRCSAHKHTDQDLPEETNVPAAFGKTSSIRRKKKAS